MRSIYLVLLLALGSTGCSSFSKSARADRAYRKYVTESKTAQEKRRKNVIEHQRAEMPSLRNTPPPVEQETAKQAPEPSPENQ